MKKVSISLLAAALALVAVESVLRWKGYDPNPSPQWRYHSLLGWTFDPPIRRVDRLNEKGFRFGPIEVRKPRQVRRLVLLGDSFTAGLGLPYDETYPGVLEKELARRSEGSWQVVSLAVNDWGSAQQLLALQEDALAYEPDVVVVQVFPLNDFCNNVKVLAHTCSLQDRHRPYFTHNARGELLPVDLDPVWARARKASLAAALLENWIRGPVGRLPVASGDSSTQDLRSYFRSQAREAGLKYEGAAYAFLPEAFQPPLIQKGWETTTLIFEQMRSLTQAREIPLLGLVVPFLKTFQEGDFKELVEAFDAPLQKDYDTTRFETIFGQLGIPHISMRRNILDSGIPPLRFFISPEDGHFSRLGHRMAAQWIVQELEHLQLLP